MRSLRAHLPYIITALALGGIVGLASMAWIRVNDRLRPTPTVVGENALLFGDSVMLIPHQAIVVDLTMHEDLDALFLSSLDAFSVEEEIRDGDYTVPLPD